MHTKHFLPLALAASLGMSASLADTITLTSGKVLEGKVLEETATEYIMEVNVTASIKDRKTFKKSEVKSIEAEAPDLKPFEALQGILPTPDRMPADYYKALIDTRVQPFIDQFPKSGHLNEVNNMLATLQEEQKKVLAGEIKLEGNWIASSDWNANAYELDAQIELIKMKKLAQLNRYRRALIAYDKLEEAFPASDALEQAKDLARGFLPRYASIISAKAASAKEKKEARENDIKNLPASDIPRVRAFHEEQEARYQAALAKAREERSKWLPENEYDERGLKTIARNINSFISALNRPSRDKKNNSQLYREAWEAAGNGDTQSTQRLVVSLKSSKMDEEYLELIEAHLEANPAPEAPKEEEAAPVEAEPKKEEADAKDKSRKKGSRNSETNAEDESQEAALPAEEEESSNSLIYGILGLALIGILVGILLKSRKSNEDE
ncbi:hypothetical protein N9908_00665 [Akkermansiaceae bacterium]|nr:hypothetical protein [Akkermansiaceae bacterium]MDB4284016.1 hypothetical protein [Akkermansiaceae bacterium]MDB4294736.1 hypothetical protein [Akkermansiaceae bacterium]